MLAVRNAELADMPGPSLLVGAPGRGCGVRVGEDLIHRPTLAHGVDLMRAGSNPRRDIRRDTPQMGTALNCGNVEGILMVDHELPLPSRGDGV